MSQSRNIALKQVDTELSYEVPEPKPTPNVKIKLTHDAKDDVNLWDFMVLGSSDLRKWEKPLRAALWLESRERTAVIGRVRNSSKSKSAMSASAFMAEMRQQALSGKKPGAGCGNKSISMCLLPLDTDPSTDAYSYHKPYGRIFCTTNPTDACLYHKSEGEKHLLLPGQILRSRGGEIVSAYHQGKVGS
jgi:hypothetical protein